MTTVSFSKINSKEIDTNEECFNPFSKHNISLFGKPSEIGHFSVDINKKITLDKSQMKYLISNFSTENLNFDLNSNCSIDTIQQYVTIEKLYQLLYWITREKECLYNLELDVDFITVRGTLSRIMCTPYSKGSYRKTWEICASKFQGVIYLSAIDMDEDMIDFQTPQQIRYQAWGYKFEQFLTTTVKNGVNIIKPVNNHEEFCIVLKNKFNNFTLLYQAEIDAVHPDSIKEPGSGDTSCYVELKTSRIITKITETFQFYSYKLVNWWAQSYLTGIPIIICGRRTYEGIVNSLEFYNVADIPVKAYGLWSSETCLNFCDKFLQFVKKTVTEDNPKYDRQIILNSIKKKFLIENC